MTADDQPRFRLTTTTVADSGAPERGETVSRHLHLEAGRFFVKLDIFLARGSEGLISGRLGDKLEPERPLQRLAVTLLRDGRELTSVRLGPAGRFYLELDFAADDRLRVQVNRRHYIELPVGEMTLPRA